uniref:Cystatin domain-containing protein n=1 Tax=Anas platyrhynchos TaxID=8839 RepID=A0A8B9ZJC2_ANAPL
KYENWSGRREEQPKYEPANSFFFFFFFLQVKPEFERREHKRYDTFRAIVYRTQVVAGINYFIKVQISNSDTGYVHLRVFQALPQENQGPSLERYQTGKTRDDPLEYF